MKTGMFLQKRMPILFIVFFSFFQSFGQQTFLDNFTVASYANNNGTSSYSANWVDSEDANPGSGRISITGGRFRFNNLDGRVASRTLNLFGATQVTLRLDFDATSRGGEGLDVQLWNASTSSWQTVATINTDAIGSITHVLTIDQISSLSEIRLAGTDNNWGTGSTIFVDNVLFTATYGPATFINDVTVSEEAGSATFTVTLNQVRPGGFSVNYTSTDGTALAGSDYTSVSGTLVFTGLAGETKTITVPILNNTYGENNENFFINLSGATNGVTIIDPIGEGTITDMDPPIPNNVPLALFREFSGYYDYTTTGGSLRTQPNGTNACSITGTSSNTLLSPIPAGATIERAYLSWAHSNFNADDIVTFEGQTVRADVIYGSTLTNRQFYGYLSDVTAIIRGIGNPSTNVYDFTGLNVDTTDPFCSSQTVLGGWTLMVFYELPTLPAVTINLYQGFSGESNSSSSYTLSGFFAIGASGSKTTVVSWEGDQTLANNERLSVASGLGLGITLSGDGDNNGVTVNNPFNSTIFDNTVTPNINTTTSHGLDLDTYDISSVVQPGESSVTTTVQSGQDFVIVNSVLLKVPSNLITGLVYEDVNYPGGAGRNSVVSSGQPVIGARVELYDSSGSLYRTTTTGTDGKYVVGGMANGTYRARVVNSSVKSTRGGGAACATCLPIQTFRRLYNAGGFVNVPNEVGGANPAGQDPGNNTLTGAQSVSSVLVLSNGIVGIDFGYNFNTIVNTNQVGQGSLNQFIVNANNLDETGLDIAANSIFDPAAGEDTSIFMIPPTGDALGRTASTTYASGYFDIFITDAQQLATMTAANTIIDGRTQTAYSGNTNPSTLGAGGTPVGVTGTSLFNFNRPEIQVHRNGGDVFTTQGNNVTIRNIAVYSNDKAGIRVNAGLTYIFENIIGVNALGVKSGAIQYGTEVRGGTARIARNFFNGSDVAGVRINGGSNSILEYNHIFQNGTGTTCTDNILIDNGSGIIIRNNLINDAAGIGIEGANYTGGLVITDNTITGNGISPVACGGGIFDDAGIRLKAATAEVSKNIIHGNRGEGVVVAENVTGIWITQNSIYNNGLRAPSLGIDLDKSKKTGDGVTLNDNGDGDNGPNNLNNFPIFKTISTNGANLILQGWARPGAIIELFLSDVSLGTALPGANQLGYSSDYGEGQTYLATIIEGSAGDLDTGVSNYTDVDGNNDNTNNFKFSIPLPFGAMVGQKITATSTIANSTSEFSPLSTIKVSTIITNRRITYRVNKS